MSRLRAFRKKLDIYSEIFLKFLGSNKFFWIVLGLFVLQALWVAFSFVYPSVYDERYHYLITEFFSNQPSPWVIDQDPYLDQFGALEGNPFLLYHYLMSFPYRFVDMFTDSLAVKVIFLRTFSIALFTLGLLAYKKLFDTLKAPAVVSNLTIAILSIIPLVTLGASIINYDSLAFLATASTVLYAIKIWQSTKPKWQDIALFILSLSVGSLSKINFLPIGVILALFVLVKIGITIRSSGLLTWLKDIKNDFKEDKRHTVKVVAVVALVVFFGLSFARFSWNIISFGSPMPPSCDQIIEDSRCDQNPLWVRAKYLDTLSHNSAPSQLPDALLRWVGIIYDGLFVTSVKTPAISEGKNHFEPPMPVVYSAAAFLLVIAPFLVGYSWRKIAKFKGIYVLIATVVIYIVALLYENLGTYYETGRFVATQGRYLILVLPILIFLGVAGWYYAFRNYKKITTLSVIVLTILLLNGGGLVTHIMRSNEQWNWSNQVIRDINNTTRNVLNPVMKEWWYER